MKRRLGAEGRAAVVRGESRTPDEPVMKLYAIALMTGVRSSGGTKSWQPWGVSLPLEEASDRWGARGRKEEIERCRGKQLA